MQYSATVQRCMMQCCAMVQCCAIGEVNGIEKHPISYTTAIGLGYSSSNLPFVCCEKVTNDTHKAYHCAMITPLTQQTEQTTKQQTTK